MLKYVEIIHSGKPVSLQEFVDLNGVKLSQELTLEMLYSYEGNYTRIQNSLKPHENSTSAIDSIVKSGVLIRIPKDSLEREYIATSSKIIVPNESFDVFIDERIKEIIENTNYKPVTKSELSVNNGNTFRQVNSFTVWVWCKSLGDSIEKGRIIDVTPFVESISTNVGENGGNFNIKLSPIVGKIKNDKGGRWELDKSGISQFFMNDRINVVTRNADNSFRKSINDTEGYLQRLFLFHNIIQSNDVVFIKFEPLSLDIDKRRNESQKLELDRLNVSPSDLVDGGGERSKQLFDMIGLVDMNSQTRSGVDTSINISGRDLMKLLLEDGEYFFPTDLSGVNGGIQTDNSNNRSINRLVSGELNFFNAYVDRSIDYSLKFIFLMLSNIRICDNDLFSYYGDDRSNRYEIAKDIVDGVPAEQLKSELLEGIWQIVKIVVDPELQNRRIVDSSIVSDQGSLKSFIDGKIIQKPFAQFYGDTYGNKYYFIARKPPFNKQSVLSNLKSAINITEDTIYSENLTWSDQEVYSWYRIIPKGNFYGDDESLALTYFPAIFFDDYASIWGSRPFQVVSNYIDYVNTRGDKGKVNLDYLLKQAYQDLSYVIECNAHLPFTRKGTLTIKGDRRIKVGNLIRLVGTQEIFHVDAVSNSCSVGESGTDRITTLSVSRGMKERFIGGMDVQVLNENGDPNSFSVRKISYFDLVREYSSEKIPNAKSYRLDRGAFNFFLRRMQVDIDKPSSNKITTS